MLYLSQLLGISVLDATGEEIGKVSDLAISTGEVFPRITSVAFLGPAKTPFMVSWRKYVDDFDGERIGAGEDLGAVYRSLGERYKELDNALSCKR